MKFVVEFRTHINNSDGIPVSAPSDLEPFVMQVEDIPVRVVPEIQPGHDYSSSPSSLTSLSAQIEFEGRSADITKQQHRTYRNAALEALRQTLIQLRVATNYPTINVHLSALEYARFFDEQHNPASDPPIFVDFSLCEGNVQDVTPELWASVTREVVEKVQCPLANELLQESRSFLFGRNFEMALLSAAVACELTLHDMILGSLVAKGLAEAEASLLVNALNNPKSREVALLLGLIDSKTNKDLADLFNLRNQIAHGDKRKGTHKVARPHPTSQDVRKAISCARKLIASIKTFRNPTESNIDHRQG